MTGALLADFYHTGSNGAVEPTEATLMELTPKQGKE